jgi:diguanylate cyclase (GGDEF)-like protein
VYIIGRSENAKIRINDESVSRVHAHLSVREGQYILEDAQSKNGTFVEGNKIESRALAEDDIVALGGVTVLKFCFVDERQERTHRRLLAAAVRDPLTGVYNRLHFDERLSAECASARRHRRPLCLLMIDIDDFKPINDRYGHPFGDHVLRGVAAAIQQTIRREDVVFRYGGEEFAVLVRETGMLGALRLADRLRERVASISFADDSVEDTVEVRISVGAAEFDPTTDERDLVARADGGLYSAKRTGKNRTVAL